MMSQTIRKYPANPIEQMTANSSCRRRSYTMAGIPLGRLRQSIRETLLRELVEIGFARQSFRYLVLRQVGFIERQLQDASFGNSDGVGDG